MQIKQTTEAKPTTNPIRRAETTGSTFAGGGVGIARGGFSSVAAMQRRFGNAAVAEMARAYAPDIQREG